MKTTQSLLTLVAGAILMWMGALPLAAEPPAGWKMIFDDEFNGDALDTTKWSTTMDFIGIHGPRYHNESYLSYTCDDEVVLSDGLLQLRTNRRTVEGAETPTVFDYTQGIISSQGKFAFNHGYIEVRAKYPGGNGLWPCIWLMPVNQGWPPEFDIAEYYGGRRTMHHGLAHGELRDMQWDSTRENAIDFESDFHVYSLEWTDGKAVWAIDGQVCKTVLADYVPNVPMFIILSNGISSPYGPSGVPDENTVFPNAFEIDYVRVYQAPPAPPAEAVLAKNDVPQKDPVIVETPAPPVEVKTAPVAPAP